MSEKKKEKIATATQNKKRNLIIIIAIALVVIIIGIVIALSKNNDKEEPNNNKDKEQTVVTEKTVEDEYDFTKEDAINAVKGMFNSDVYEFDARVREDNMYIVTVTNSDTGSTYTYVVNPNNGTFEELVEE